MKPIRIGLLGASRIAGAAVITPARTNPEFEVVAVACRDKARANAYAAEHGVATALDSYRELLARDDIDLVYNALPPAHHARWCIDALASGKAVLCEKPFSLTAAEAREMVAAAERSGRPLIEAFHYRHHPAIKRAVEIVSSTAFGAVTKMDVTFETPIPYEAFEPRWHAELGGGALFDLGCYAVHIMRTFAGTEPALLLAQSRWLHGVDETTIATLRFPNGPIGKLRTSMVSPSFRADLNVNGENGSLGLTNFVAPHLGGKLQIRLDGCETEEECNSVTTYTWQMTQVANVILRGQAPLVSGEDSIANMACLEAIVRMAATQPALA